MKKFLKSKKGLALLAALVVAVAASVGAYAYFTTTGSGSGTASVGTSSNITIAGSTSGTLYPGTSEAVSFSANNPSAGHQKLGTIVLDGVKACPSGSAWDPTLNSNVGGCTNSASEVTTCESFSGGASNDLTKNFYMAPVAENQDLPSGNTPSLTGGTLYMNDLSSSQDDCKNANLWLHFSAAAPAS
jgi:hypothetical protein